MPETIRTARRGHRVRPHCGAVGAGIALALAAATPARAAADTYVAAFAAMDRHEIAALALTFAIIAFAVVTAIQLLRTRARAAEAEQIARAENLALKAEVDLAYALLLSERQVIVVWASDAGEPEIIGDTTLVTAAPVARRVLAFGTWLDAERAQAIEHAVEALRARGEAFTMSLVTTAGRHIEAEGRAVGGRAILRLKDMSGVRRELAQLAGMHQDLVRDVDTIKSLIEALPSPVWLRDAAGRLVWVNQAYARAVDARNADEVVARNLELLDSAARAEAQNARALAQSYSARLPIVASGKRLIVDVLDIATRGGSAGIGIDVTEVESMRGEVAHMVEAHRRTLDQLSTAVAVFGSDRRLSFYNATYRALWGLDAAFLDQAPTDSMVLDRLRVARKLPEQTDFRQWKGQLHEAYRAIDPREHWWHLPDGRTLRVVTTPNPEGGVTYLFDDVTERLDLERRFDALIRVQGETLDNLSEAVAVFGSDGCLRLHNPAFVTMWRLDPATLTERPHIEGVITALRPLHDDAAAWQALRAAVTGLDQRVPVVRRMERKDGSVVDCVTVPLPDGATLVTFQDITDTVNVERALRERNEALEAADGLKNDFVHHVSYELRSPLTNIIGFAQLLDDTASGPLTAKQREYLGYITTSSTALLAIINDILDLATIDAGAMTLDLGPVDIRRAMDAASEGVKDRLVENAIRLDIHAEPDIGTFVADERRVRQILFNLLSNAVGFSPPRETVALTAARRPDAVVFTVTDRGPGIPQELIDRVFDRFETHALGSAHRGAGLGLSIVRSFVELHGGKVTIESRPGHGTTVVCVFPLEHTVSRVAAE